MFSASDRGMLLSAGAVLYAFVAYAGADVSSVLAWDANTMKHFTLAYHKSVHWESSYCYKYGVNKVGIGEINNAG